MGFRQDLDQWIRSWDGCGAAGEELCRFARSVVDQAIGSCKTEASRKPVVIDEHIAQALTACRQESTYTGPNDWLWASPQKRGRQPLWLATVMRYYIHPAVKRAGIEKKIGWHTFRHTFSTLVKSLGFDAKVVQELLRHASFNNDGRVHAGFRTKTPSASRFGEPDHAHGDRCGVLWELRPGCL